MTQIDCILVPRVQLDHLVGIAMSDNDLLTIKEAAKYLRCSTVTLWKIRKDANIHPVRVGKKFLFRRSSLDGYLNKGKGGNQ